MPPQPLQHPQTLILGDVEHNSGRFPVELYDGRLLGVIDPADHPAQLLAQGLQTDCLFHLFTLKRHQNLKDL